MQINNAQLQTWANPPGSTRIQATHQQIRQAIENSPLFRDHSISVYLQGSYANSTNIRGDSDVDVVVELRSSHFYDLSQLPAPQQAQYMSNFVPATYLLEHFKADVLRALKRHFGDASIQEGNKSIKFLGSQHLLRADVVPCVEYHQYSSYFGPGANTRVKGMKFFDRQGNEIVNFPKLHIGNGEQKNGLFCTSGKYKDLVRVYKNLRGRLETEHGFAKAQAPSYFIESLIYNVPDNLFGLGDHQDAFERSLDYLLNHAMPDRLLTPSHQHLVFGTKPWQWNTSHASTFVQGVRDYYLANRA